MKPPDRIYLSLASVEGLAEKDRILSPVFLTRQSIETVEYRLVKKKKPAPKKREKVTDPADNSRPT